MNRPVRSIEIFTMSALDLFVTAMGSFAILMMILFPYYRVKKTPKKEDQPGAKSTLLFCVWDTRMKDYEQFYNEVLAKTPQGPTDPNEPWKRSDYWKRPNEVSGLNHSGLDELGPDFPVVNVSWDESVAFCKWLTEKERKAGIIGPEDEYRLPTNAEWTAAAGPDKFPWGNQWPPPPDAGAYANLAGKEHDELYGTVWREESGTYSAEIGSLGFRDPFVYLAPVDSLEPNLYGLYHMGGNVINWCSDWYRRSLNSDQFLKQYNELEDDGGGSKYRVIRGGGWSVGVFPFILLPVSSGAPPEGKHYDTGFRCVLALKPRSAK